MTCSSTKSNLEKSGKQTKTLTLGPDGVFGPELENEIAGYNLSALRDEIELIQGAGNAFDMELVSKGKLSPVFFGSALADFGTIPFLEDFWICHRLPARARPRPGEVQPTDDFFSGFIFKIQANMNPAHRDRLAFLRICSGTFTRGMSVRAVPDRQGNETGAVHHADGQRTRKRRNCDRGRYHRDL